MKSLQPLSRYSRPTKLVSRLCGPLQPSSSQIRPFSSESLANATVSAPTDRIEAHERIINVTQNLSASPTSSSSFKLDMENEELDPDRILNPMDPSHPAYPYYANMGEVHPANAFGEDLKALLLYMDVQGMSDLLRTHRSDYLMCQERHWVMVLDVLIQTRNELEFLDHVVYLIARQPVLWTADTRLLSLILFGLIRFDLMGCAVAILTHALDPSQVRTMTPVDVATERSTRVTTSALIGALSLPAQGVEWRKASGNQSLELYTDHELIDDFQNRVNISLARCDPYYANVFDVASLDSLHAPLMIFPKPMKAAGYAELSLNYWDAMLQNLACMLRGEYNTAIATHYYTHSGFLSPILAASSSITMPPQRTNNVLPFANQSNILTYIQHEASQGRIAFIDKTSSHGVEAFEHICRNLLETLSITNTMGVDDDSIPSGSVVTGFGNAYGGSSGYHEPLTVHTRVNRVRIYHTWHKLAYNDEGVIVSGPFAGYDEHEIENIEPLTFPIYANELDVKFDGDTTTRDKIHDTTTNTNTNPTANTTGGAGASADANMDGNGSGAEVEEAEVVIRARDVGGFIPTDANNTTNNTIRTTERSYLNFDLSRPIQRSNSGVPASSLHARAKLRFKLTKLLTLHYRVDPAGLCFNPQCSFLPQNPMLYSYVSKVRRALHQGNDDGCVRIAGNGISSGARDGAVASDRGVVGKSNSGVLPGIHGASTGIHGVPPGIRGAGAGAGAGAGGSISIAPPRTDAKPTSEEEEALLMDTVDEPVTTSKTEKNHDSDTIQNDIAVPNSHIRALSNLGYSDIEIVVLIENLRVLHHYYAQQYPCHEALFDLLPSAICTSGFQEPSEEFYANFPARAIPRKTNSQKDFSPLSILGGREVPEETCLPKLPFIPYCTYFTFHSSTLPPAVYEFMVTAYIRYFHICSRLLTSSRVTKTSLLRRYALALERGMYNISAATPLCPIIATTVPLPAPLLSTHEVPMRELAPLPADAAALATPNLAHNTTTMTAADANIATVAEESGVEHAAAIAAATVTTANTANTSTNTNTNTSAPISPSVALLRSYACIPDGVHPLDCPPPPLPLYMFAPHAKNIPEYVPDAHGNPVRVPYFSHRNDCSQPILEPHQIAFSQARHIFPSYSHTVLAPKYLLQPPASSVPLDPLLTARYPTSGLKPVEKALAEGELAPTPHPYVPGPHWSKDMMLGYFFGQVNIRVDAEEDDDQATLLKTKTQQLYDNYHMMQKLIEPPTLTTTNNDDNSTGTGTGSSRVSPPPRQLISALRRHVNTSAEYFSNMGLSYNDIVRTATTATASTSSGKAGVIDANMGKRDEDGEDGYADEMELADYEGDVDADTDMNAQPFNSMYIMSLRATMSAYALALYNKARAIGLPMVPAFYSALLTRIAKGGNISRVHALIRHMTEAGYEPGSSVYVSLLRAMDSRSRVFAAKQIMVHMANSKGNNAPDTHMFDELLRGCVSTGNAEESCQWLRSILHWNTLLASTKNGMKSVFMFEYIGKHARSIWSDKRDILNRDDALKFIDANFPLIPRTTVFFPEHRQTQIRIWGTTIVPLATTISQMFMGAKNRYYAEVARGNVYDRHWIVNTPQQVQRRRAREQQRQTLVKTRPNAYTCNVEHSWEVVDEVVKMHAVDVMESVYDEHMKDIPTYIAYLRNGGAGMTEVNTNTNTNTNASDTTTSTATTGTGMSPLSAVEAEAFTVAAPHEFALDMRGPEFAEMRALYNSPQLRCNAGLPSDEPLTLQRALMVLAEVHMYYNSMWDDGVSLAMLRAAVDNSDKETIEWVLTTIHDAQVRYEVYRDNNPNFVLTVPPPTLSFPMLMTVMHYYATIGDKDAFLALLQPYLNTIPEDISQKVMRYLGKIEKPVNFPIPDIEQLYDEDLSISLAHVVNMLGQFGLRTAAETLYNATRMNPSITLRASHGIAIIRALVLNGDFLSAANVCTTLRLRFHNQTRGVDYYYLALLENMASMIRQYGHVFVKHRQERYAQVLVSLRRTTHLRTIFEQDRLPEEKDFYGAHVLKEAVTRGKHLRAQIEAIYSRRMADMGFDAVLDTMKVEHVDAAAESVNAEDERDMMGAGDVTAATATTTTTTTTTTSDADVHTNAIPNRANTNTKTAKAAVYRYGYARAHDLSESDIARVRLVELMSKWPFESLLSVEPLLQHHTKLYTAVAQLTEDWCVEDRMFKREKIAESEKRADMAVSHASMQVDGENEEDDGVGEVLGVGMHSLGGSGNVDKEGHVKDHVKAALWGSETDIVRSAASPLESIEENEESGTNNSPVTELREYMRKDDVNQNHLWTSRKTLALKKEEERLVRGVLHSVLPKYYVFRKRTQGNKGNSHLPATEPTRGHIVRDMMETISSSLVHTKIATSGRYNLTPREKKRLASAEELREKYGADFNPTVFRNNRKDNLPDALRITRDDVDIELLPEISVDDLKEASKSSRARIKLEKETKRREELQKAPPAANAAVVTAKKHHEKTSSPHASTSTPRTSRASTSTTHSGNRARNPSTSAHASSESKGETEKKTSKGETEKKPDASKRIPPKKTF